MLFKAADLNGDGDLTNEEMRGFVRNHRGSVNKRLGYEFDFKAFRSSMLLFDSNRDGKTQLEEFAHWYAYGDGRSPKEVAVALQQCHTQSTLSPKVKKLKEF